VRHRHATTPRCRRQLQSQRPLQGLALALLVLVLRPCRVLFGEVLLRLPQHPGQHRRDVVVRRWRHLHGLASAVLRSRRRRPPLPLRQQHVQVRRQLQHRAEPLREDDSASLERRRHAPPPRLTPLPPPHRPHQPHLEPLQQLRLLHHLEALREGQTQCPLPVPDARQERCQSDSRFHCPPVGARRAPPSSLAAERHQP